MRKPLLACLLFSFLTLPSSVGAQGVPPPPPGAVLFDAGKSWKTTAEAERQAYLRGFMDGAHETYFKALAHLGKSWTREQFMPLYIATHPAYTVEVLSRMISSFYADPANTFIAQWALIDIARDKLDGKDVEPLLRAARAQKRAYYAAPNP